MTSHFGSYIACSPDQGALWHTGECVQPCHAVKKPYLKEEDGKVVKQHAIPTAVQKSVCFSQFPHGVFGQ